MGQKLHCYFNLKSLISVVRSCGLRLLSPHQGKLSHIQVENLPLGSTILNFFFFFLQYVFKYIFFSIVEKQSEVVDSAAAERDFTGKLIDVLKNKEAGIKQEKFVIKTHAGEFRNLGGVDNSSFDKGDQNS